MSSTFSKTTQPFDFIKPNVTWKLANKVKYISQSNGGLIRFFLEIPEEHFLKLVGSIVNNMKRINTRKGTQSTVQCSKCYDNFHFLSIYHRSIDNSIDFYFFTLKRLMITMNFVVKIKNLVVNHDSWPVKLNSAMRFNLFQTSVMFHIEASHLFCFIKKWLFSIRNTTQG